MTLALRTTWFGNRKIACLFKGLGRSVGMRQGNLAFRFQLMRRFHRFDLSWICCTATNRKPTTNPRHKPNGCSLTTDGRRTRSITTPHKFHNERMCRSHPEMVGDMSRATLNFDLSKIPLCVSSQGQDLYSHQKLNMRIYWFSSDDDNAGRHNTTTIGDISRMRRERKASARNAVAAMS